MFDAKMDATIPVWSLDPDVDVPAWPSDAELNDELDGPFGTGGLAWIEDVKLDAEVEEEPRVVINPLDGLESEDNGPELDPKLDGPAAPSPLDVADTDGEI